jgi:Histidine kinase-, DNA gyrase B-, and HSP90-like ATPase
MAAEGRSLEKETVAPESTLVERISTISPEQQPILARLSTDEQVFARITDGIYRMPSSALRELVSNAYDADARVVTIDTDAPRFDTITVRDDGNGMSAEALANLVEHIGGSLKRRSAGSIVGVTSPDDSSKSPGGRRLIGKIGIGLFAVSQLTQRFQIITKERGSSQRLIATIELKQYTEDELENRDAGEGFQTGTAEISAVAADDKEAHGTDIILLDIKPQAQKILRSSERWLAKDRAGEANFEEPGTLTFHIGRVSAQDSSQLITQPSLPWTRTDDPLNRFQKLVDAVISQVGVSPKLPTVEETLDNYFGTLWSLSLAAPLEYVYGAPWDLGPSDQILGFSLRGDSGTTPLPSAGGEAFNEALPFAPTESATPFRVVVDGTELRRPIVFRNLSTERELVTTPLFFADSRDIDLTSFNEAITGGSRLCFSAYLFWTPKVVPKENNGVLVRINNASGTLFDPKFMGYRTNEQQRLRQISVEVFVSEGLDAALNIDRESFNFAHPHYQILSNWLHRSLTRAINRQKLLGKEESTKRKQGRAMATTSRAQEIGRSVWHEHRGKDEPELDGLEDDLQAGLSAVTSSEQRALIENLSVLSKNDDVAFAKLSAISLVLEAYDLLSGITEVEKLRLLRHIADILTA